MRMNLSKLWERLKDRKPDVLQSMSSQRRTRLSNGTVERTMEYLAAIFLTHHIERKKEGRRKDIKEKKKG